MRHRPFASLVLPCLVVLTLAPRPAAAQAAPPVPPVELGGHIGSLTALARPAVAGPRVTFNVSRRTSVELTAELQLPEPDRMDDGYVAERLYQVQLRQQLHQAGRLKLSALVGTGWGYREFRVTPFPDPFRGDLRAPAETFRTSIGTFMSGVSGEVTVAPYLALRGDAGIVIGSRAGYRLTAGASVPIGRFPIWPARPAASSRDADAALARRLRPGREIWVTLGTGDEHQALVTGFDGRTISLALPDTALSLPMADVRRIEVRDSVENGIGWGALAGGASVGVLSTIFVSAYCRGNSDCGGNPFGYVFVTSGIGAGMGAAIGAAVDSLIEGRQVVYESDRTTRTLAVAPLIVKGGGGMGASLSWGGGRRP